MDERMQERLISGYAEWKSWTPGAALTDQYSVYSEELARAHLQPAAHILEIGFGEATFLNWARDEGYRCAGLEINPELVDAARQLGHDVRCGSVRDAFPSERNLFDAVVLFDVLEHIGFNDILGLFDELNRLLRPDGKIIARFPNGASPFGRAYQYGDATHVSVLTGTSLAQIGLATGFELLGQYNAARGKRSRSGGLRNNPLARRAAFLLRDMLQWVISLAYFGRNIPMDPNLTVILRKRNSTRDGAVLRPES